MLNLKNTVLGALALAGSTLVGALGGWDAALRVLVAMMCADYLTGVTTAALWRRSDKTSTGALSSRAGFQGLIRKGAVLTVVWIGCQLDLLLGAAYVRSAVCLFFIGNEGLSLLENLGLMGVPFPKFLRSALETLQEKGEDGNG